MSPVLTPLRCCDAVAEDDLVQRRRLVRQLVDALQLLADVVGVEHRVFRRLPQAVGTVRQDVGQRAHVHAEVAVERAHATDAICGRLYSKPSVPSDFSTTTGVGRNGSRIFLHGHRAGARTAAAVRRGEGLVQVQVHHVDAEVAGPRLADQRVHVGAVHVEQRALARAGSSAILWISLSKTPRCSDWSASARRHRRSPALRARRGRPCPSHSTSGSRPRSRRSRPSPDWCRAPSRE